MAVRSTLILVSQSEQPPSGEGMNGAVKGGAGEKLTRKGFDRFLFQLDPDRDAAGRKYEVLRGKLISYFDWRDCPFPEDHADEALSRVIGKLEADEEFRDVTTYVFGIARMMLLEIARRMEKERVALSQLPSAFSVAADSNEVEMKSECLRLCLAGLPQKSRELITKYYEGDGATKIVRRKELAANLGMQLNALRIRACRLREKLEECMGRCLVSKRS
jgi:DNA-directed RNA polymerase specialized sigma24 family protein